MNKVFEYVAVFHPSEKERENGDKDHIIVDLTQILALDEKGAILCAARAIPDNYADRLDQVELVCRPF